MDHNGWTFLCGCAPFVNFGFFARERDDVADQDVTATSFYVWDNDDPNPDQQWAMYREIVGWRAQGMASVKPAFGHRITVALGTKGQYFEVEPQTLREFSGTIVGFSGLVRRVATIGSMIFAAGMGRSVIRREDRGTWLEFGPGTTDADEDRVIGFEGIDGYSADEIFVAGWHGEIWRWFRGNWERIASPTNANLNSVACASDGTVYVVGDNGILVRGIQNGWEVIDTGRPENLHDVVVFEDDVFVATDYDILRLGPKGLTPEDRFLNGDMPSTCLRLLAAEDGVFSLGPKDLFVFFHGFWRRII